MAFEPLADAEVLRAVRALVSQSKIGWTDHAEDRMAERGFSKGQVKKCLQNGYFSESPTIPNRPGAIQYKFTMQAVDEGSRIAVAASLIPDKKVVVITIIDVD